jgi:hypothetical protein
MNMELLEELKNKQAITREDIEQLLQSIGIPGDQREAKVEAIKQLNLSNFQQVPLETQLMDYPSY